MFEDAFDLETAFVPDSASVVTQLGRRSTVAT